MYEALSIIASTCIGSIAVYAIFLHGNSFLQMIQVFAVVAVCSTLNASILTVQKPKIVFNSLVTSLLVCSILAILNFLF